MVSEADTGGEDAFTGAGAVLQAGAKRLNPIMPERSIKPANHLQVWKLLRGNVEAAGPFLYLSLSGRSLSSSLIAQAIHAHSAGVLSGSNKAGCNAALHEWK